MLLTALNQRLKKLAKSSFNNRYCQHQEINRNTSPSAQTKTNIQLRIYFIYWAPEKFYSLFLITEVFYENTKYTISIINSVIKQPWT